jgi:rubrerythrin
MKTSKQWWTELKTDEKKIIAWLRKQYHGEALAAERLNQIVDRLHDSNPHKKTIQKIAQQEAMHSVWIQLLLISRGQTPKLLKRKSRYWTRTLPRGFASMNLTDLAAIGAHAEKMRLGRIRTIASDRRAPKDIRDVFQRILSQEEFHERAFRRIAGKTRMLQAEANHKKGMRALGLVA